MSSSAAIRAAADRLGRGDIILLEIHRPGPNAPMPRQGQLGFIAIEWWPDDFAAIRYAVARGIAVVEAAGNGFENLDAAVYNARPVGFPSSWTNPLNPANPSSGAVIVGCGGTTARHPRSELGTRSLASRFLQLGCARRCAGMGTRGDHHWVRRSAGRFES